jgi:hypothetical protein|nr:MAG TPA: AAA domain protein [Caudoviricetes sp.]
MNFTITNTRKTKPMKVVLYGVEGIGKTTFVSHFPDPIFIDTEGSTGFIDARKLPDPDSWTMLLEEINFMAQNPQGKTLVIDTADWAEELAKQHLMAKHHWQAIDQTDYGTRYVALSNEIIRLLRGLEMVKNAGMNVVLTAHAVQKKFELPDQVGSFDRYVLKLEKRDAALIKEWCDMLLFANYKTTVVASGSGSKKATGGQRVMYTTHMPAWDAKNRLGLPDELPFEYGAIKDKFLAATTEGAQAKQQTNGLPCGYPYEYPPSVPQKVVELASQSGLNPNSVMTIIYNGKFMPEGTPIEAVPTQLWEHIADNWQVALSLTK